jgi:hypothetical protein
MEYIGPREREITQEEVAETIGFLCIFGVVGRLTTTPEGQEVLSRPSTKGLAALAALLLENKQIPDDTELLQDPTIGKVLDNNNIGATNPRQPHPDEQHLYPAAARALHMLRGTQHHDVDYDYLTKAINLYTEQFLALCDTYKNADESLGHRVYSTLRNIGHDACFYYTAP